MENQTKSLQSVEELNYPVFARDAEGMLNLFNVVRRQTIELVETLEIEDYVIQTDTFMSPPRWHIGHVSWFYEQLLKQHHKNYTPYKKDYSFYLNSYYNAFGEPFNKSKRGTLSRPTVNETIEYWKWINIQVTHFFRESEMTDEIRRLFLLAYNHEWQHQELMVYDLQHLLQDRYNPKVQKFTPSLDGNPYKKEMIKINGGLFELGYDENKWKDFFAYDIEMPLHKVFLNDYYIDNTPVTNGEFLEFIADGGYTNYKYWLSDGWETVKRNNWEAPLYWEKDGNGDWFRTDFKGRKLIKQYADEPVTNLSYYEADAYAKWAGKRLPTEAEWEKAACWDEDRNEKRLFPWGDESPNDINSNLLESKVWSVCTVHNYPGGRSYYGCYDMLGDCWEWTQSEFMAYPGFRSGFAEYNDKWFGNQKVLRGGSFGTPRLSTRNTYRNFFRPDERWLISGFRCAKDT
jgi:ergothioneine biosynthesis protein EgtB